MRVVTDDGTDKDWFGTAPKDAEFASSIENSVVNWKTRNVPKNRKDYFKANTPFLRNLLKLFAVLLIVVIIESVMAPFVLKLLSNAVG